MDSNQEQTYIEQLENSFHTALSKINQEVPPLITSGKLMQGLLLFHNHLAIIGQVYELLNDAYLLIFNSQDLLKKCGSLKLKELRHPLVATRKVSEHLGVSTDLSFANDPEYAHIYLREILELGFQKKEHWGISTVVLTEIEYMLKVLKVLVEPNYTPLSLASSEKNESEVDRHITRQVKIAVWQRDRGQCVECGSKELLEYDHIIPVSKGGSNTERNIQLLCEKCNRKKGALIQ